jgi:hypothetical protein
MVSTCATRLKRHVLGQPRVIRKNYSARLSNNERTGVRLCARLNGMMKDWFLAITDFSVYRCRKCRQLINTPTTMEPLLKHLAKYHARALAVATRVGRSREIAQAQAAAA